MRIKHMLGCIAFVGGIHGVGKSTICKLICAEAGLLYLSASEVLKWKEINEDEANKQVSDIHYTQNRLISGLNAIVTRENRYLLDGHYCLLGSKNVVERIPIETFKLITPFSLNLIIDDVNNVRRRLEARDNKPYNEDLLRELQDDEINYAKELSETLNIKLNIGTNKDVSQIIDTLKISQP